MGGHSSAWWNRKVIAPDPGLAETTARNSNAAHAPVAQAAPPHSGLELLFTPLAGTRYLRTWERKGCDRSVAHGPYPAADPQPPGRQVTVRHRWAAGGRVLRRQRDPGPSPSRPALETAPAAPGVGEGERARKTQRSRAPSSRRGGRRRHGPVPGGGRSWAHGASIPFPPRHPRRLSFYASFSRGSAWPVRVHKARPLRTTGSLHPGPSGPTGFRRWCGAVRSLVADR